MRISLPLIFSILLISSVVVLSSDQNSFGEEIIVTNTGLENSTILEIKNMRGNIGSIESVRIWTVEDNEFTSFKTEKGWTGKKELNGVIEFLTDSPINPGENVKFGIKTSEKNPIINWKAIDKEGNALATGSSKTSIKNAEGNETGLSQISDRAINEDSRFRLIPEQPSKDASFRLVGENFIPKQKVDFYIHETFIETIKIDEDGKILFSGKVPSNLESDRTEFILQDDSGEEKVLSLRIQDKDIRKTGQIVKLTMGNTPQEVKRGDVIKFEGMASPSTTLTITSKDAKGQILDISTIEVGPAGTWTHDNLFSPELQLGQLSIEINDGKTKILRNISVISSSLINISSEETRYEVGDVVKFTGNAIPNKEISIILEDGIGTQIHSKSLTVGNSGSVSFDIEIPKDSVEGTYTLFLYQGGNEDIVIFGVGQEPKSIITLKPVKTNFSSNDDILISIQGDSNAQVLVIVVDSKNREVLSESINLGPDGRNLYQVDSNKVSTDAYTVIAQRGESVNEAKFSVGFTTGSGNISIQTTKSEYQRGEQMLILGKADSKNVIINLRILDVDGRIIKSIETFTDQSGFYNIDNFKIPIDAKLGTWKIDVRSGVNNNSVEFEIKNKVESFSLELEKSVFKSNETMIISGSGSSGGTISVKIMNMEEEEITRLSFASKENGDYSSMWMIPPEIVEGKYKIIVNDGINITSSEFRIEN